MASLLVATLLASFLMPQDGLANGNVTELNGTMDMTPTGHVLPHRASPGLIKNKALSMLFNMFLKLHETSGAMNLLPSYASSQNTATSPVKETTPPNEEPRSDLRHVTLEHEFGAPLTTKLPEPDANDLTVILSVGLTTVIILMCFAFLLIMQCCADIICIDLLYYFSKCTGWKQRQRHPRHSRHHRRHHRPFTDGVVVPYSPSTERLLRGKSNSRSPEPRQEAVRMEQPDVRGT
ncbi:uncharacterized protein LOC135370830 [Ornithodoros turicata]|uniref:uncharacterized protein LOC135370830 n=1 Tax=Ornithodoros turicata TaxID=34597 RepID=UPI003138CEEF